MIPLGKQLVLIGGLLIVIGLVLIYGDKLTGVYKNPLDFSFKKGATHFYFPLGSSLLISLLLSLLVYFFRK
ncbi:MAG: DUF2905 family protein [Flavobacteriaceae bacterium]